MWAGGATLRGSVELQVTQIVLLNCDPVRKSKDEIPGGVTQPLLKTMRSLLSNIGETPLRRVPRRTPTDFEGIGVISIPLTARRWVQVPPVQVVGLSRLLQKKNQINKRYTIAQMMICTLEDNRQEMGDLRREKARRKKARSRGDWASLYSRARSSNFVFDGFQYAQEY